MGNSQQGHKCCPLLSDKMTLRLHHSSSGCALPTALSDFVREEVVGVMTDSPCSETWIGCHSWDIQRVKKPM